MIVYREQEGILSESILYEIADLAKNLDQQTDASIESYKKAIQMGLAGKTWVHVALAYEDDLLIAYKLGRSDDPRCFESWTAPDTIPMLILNLKQGFIISRIILVRGAHMNVALHKSLM